jgi:microcystin degradation protein MlrC
MQIALGSLFTESNHLGGAPTDLDCFRRQELLDGDEVLHQTAGTVGGMVQTLREDGASIRPLLVATACPGGPLTAACYRQLKGELLERPGQQVPVDGLQCPYYPADRNIPGLTPRVVTHLSSNARG